MTRSPRVLRHSGPVCGGAEAAEGLLEAPEETDKRTQRDPQEAPQEGTNTPGQNGTVPLPQMAPIAQLATGRESGKWCHAAECRATFVSATTLFSYAHWQVWNLSKEQKSRSTQIQSDTQRRRSQMEKHLKRSIKKK